METSFSCNKLALCPVCWHMGLFMTELFFLYCDVNDVGVQ